MAEADSQSTEQCKAITGSGDRCSRPAQEDGFCHQHDESDQTVSESETEDQPDEQTESIEQEETVDPEDVDTEDVDTEDVDVDSERIEGVLAVRQVVESSASTLIGHTFDGVSEISAAEDGWRAVVEVVERTAVPDTQDIIGRYEIELDEDAVIQGYRRVDRYRRGDTAVFE